MKRIFSLVFVGCLYLVLLPLGVKTESSCTSEQWPCSNVYARRGEDGSLRRRSGYTTCQCIHDNGQCRKTLGPQFNFLNSLTWEIATLTVEKYVIQSYYCKPLDLPDRTCKPGEVAAGFQSPYEGHLSFLNCTCPNRTEPLKQVAVYKIPGITYQHFACEKPTCSVADNECARVYGTEKNEHRSTEYPCDCPDDHVCPFTFVTFNVASAAEYSKDEIGRQFRKVYCVKKSESA